MPVNITFSIDNNNQHNILKEIIIWKQFYEIIFIFIYESCKQIYKCTYISIIDNINFKLLLNTENLGTINYS